MNIFEVTEQLSDLAEVITKTILKIVYRELKVKYGTPVGENGEKSRLYTIAMGKLGGREINYYSDLDLIFVYTLNGETTGPKKISNIEFYTKMIQKFITYLSVPTKEGKLYEIDMRLRPSGKAGPLVTSFNSFRDYHSRESAIWEKLALTRARVLEKDDWGMELMRIIQKSLLNQKIGDVEREEIAHIKRRMENELVKDKYEFKYSPGGLVDIEFITQYLILTYSGKYPDLLTQNTWDAIGRIEKHGLLSYRDISTLKKAYIFYRILENRLRLTKDHSSDALPDSREEIEKIAMKMGFKGRDTGHKMLLLLEKFTKKVRKIYSNLIEKGRKM